MSRQPSGSPPYRGGPMPFPQQIYPAPPAMPYHEQPHQHGMYVAMANPYEVGQENSGWYPQQYNPNHRPYYQAGQQGFSAPLLPLNYNYSPNRYDQSMRDTSPPRHGRYSPICWQSPTSEYMVVPQNSPVHSTSDLVSQSYPLSGSPEFRKPATLPQQRRHRAPTFPGADAPNLSFFEGSKKSDWGTYTNFNPPKKGNCAPATFPSNSNVQILGDISAATKYNILGGPYVSQDVVNFNGFMKQQQSRGQDIGQWENQHPHYNRERSPPRNRAQFSGRTRKPHFARSTMIAPAIPNVTWARRERNQSDTRPSRNVNANGTFGYYPEPLSSVDSASLSPASSSARIDISSLVYTPSRSGPRSTSPRTAEEPSESRFKFNPKAEDFVLIPESDSMKVSEADEYVGFYLSSGATPLQPCDPMAWQVPDTLTSPNAQSLRSGGESCNSQCQSYVIEKSPEEFIGDIPDNMNWEKNFLPADKKFRAKSWASTDSEDRMDTITGENPATISDEPQKELDVVLDVVENLILPEINLQEAISTEAPYNTDDGEPVKSNAEEVPPSEPTADVEVAQTVTNGTNFFDHDCHNVVKLPEYVDTQLFQGFHEASKQCVEQAVDTRGTNEKVLFEDGVHVKFPNSSQAGAKSPDRAEVAVVGETPHQEVAESYTQPLVIVEPKLKSKNVKAKAKPELKPKLASVSGPKTKPRAKAEVAKLDQHPAPPSEDKTGPNTEGEQEPLQKLLLCENEVELKIGDEKTAEDYPPLVGSKAVLKTEDYPHPKETSPNLFGIPDTSIKDTKIPKVFNYRDALLTNAVNPQTSISPPSKVIHPKVISQKAMAPLKDYRQPTPTGVEATLPPAQIGGRRKFFLSPLPTTATYDSVIRQLKGGMLEDIYISGLSPHPSAWKGPRGQYSSSQDFPHDNIRHAHASFYSEEGASKFWELVQGGRGPASPYQSRYGGFDDQPPGFFYLDGMRVLVNWRHNDQRVVNPSTVKAVTEEKATRCLLLTFNVEVAMRNRHMTPFLACTRETGKSDEHAFIKKVAADIENWGQADSNLQGIRLFDTVLENTLISQKVAAPNTLATNTVIKPNLKEVKVLVSFIKLLTAVKMKKYLSSRQSENNGLYTVEYHKDECDEPIDTLRAIREANSRVAKHHYRDVKETTPEPSEPSESSESSAEYKRTFTRTEPTGTEGNVSVVEVVGAARGTAVAVKVVEVDGEGFVVKGKGKGKGKEKLRSGNGKKSHPA